MYDFLSSLFIYDTEALIAQLTGCLPDVSIGNQTQCAWYLCWLVGWCFTMRFKKNCFW